MIAGGGACNPDHEGPLPPPIELGAPPLAEGVRAGVGAIYASDTSRPDSRGEPCYGFIRLYVDGEARRRSACTSDGTAAGLRERLWQGNQRDNGDYGLLDGQLWVRLVSWNPITRDYELSESELRYCDDRLVGAAGASFVLIAGDPPPDAPPCE